MTVNQLVRIVLARFNLRYYTIAQLKLPLYYASDNKTVFNLRLVYFLEDFGLGCLCMFTNFACQMSNVMRIISSLDFIYCFGMVLVSLTRKFLCFYNRLWRI